MYQQCLADKIHIILIIHTYTILIIHTYVYRTAQFLTGGNIDEFDKFLVIRQILPFEFFFQ